MYARAHLSLKKSESILTRTWTVDDERKIHVGSAVWEQLSFRTKASGVFRKADVQRQVENDLVVLNSDSGQSETINLRIDARCSTQTGSTTIQRLDFIAEHLEDQSLVRAALLGKDVGEYAAVNERIEKIKKLLSRQVCVRGVGLVGEQTLRILRRVNVVPVAFAEVGPTATDYCGLPVVSLDSVSVDHTIVIGTARHCNDVYRDLKDRGYSNIITLPEVLAAYDELGQPESMFRKVDEASSHQWWNLLLTVADSASVKTLFTLLEYRSTLDTRVLEPAIVRTHTQWFDPVVLESSPDLLIDCGAFDGDTIELFKDHFPRFVEAIGIEPDARLAERALQRNTPDPRIRIINAAAGETDGTVHMVLTQGMDGQASATSDFGSVSMVAIDSIVKESDFDRRCIYLKIDVEGAELRVLEGAKNLISKRQPIIGIAAYHRASDIWDLIHEIAKIGLTYDFYIRHYTPVTFETVIYAIPR